MDYVSIFGTKEAEAPARGTRLSDAQPEEAYHTVGGAVRSLGQGSNTGPGKYNTDYLPSIVASNVDWLSVSIAAEVPYERLCELYRMAGEDATQDTAFVFAGEPLVCKRGTGKASVILHSDLFDFRLVDVDGSVTAVASVYSPAFWSAGISDCFNSLQVWCDWFFDAHVDLKPSRIDLCRDFTGFPMPSLEELPDFMGRLVCRAKRSRPELRHSDGSWRVETLYIGSSSSAALLRIYDKTAELAHSKKQYYSETWRAGGWDGEARITRVEYRLNRDFLSSWRDADGVYVCDTIWGLLDALGSIWQYLMREHCRMAVPDASDTNRSRWRMAAPWHVVASPFLPDCVVSLGSRHLRHNLRREAIEAQIIGCFRTFMAMMDGGHFYDVSELCDGFAAMIARLESRRSMSWSELVSSRRRELITRAA